MQKLSGKVALVSGSGRGIGRAIAEKLAREGARVVVNDLDEAPAMDTVKSIVDAGGEAVPCIGSVTDHDFADQFVTTAIDNYERIDIIVNNAGYTWDSVIQKLTDEQWNAMLDVHLSAPMRILRAASSYIRDAAKQEAAMESEVFRKVVNVSSMTGLCGNGGQIAYGAAKAGILGVTRTLAKEWGRYKVNVNCVAFGVIETRLTQVLESDASIEMQGKHLKVGMQQGFRDQLEQAIPLGRVGTAQEGADAVYLFCSPESNYISGQLVNCSGGLRT